MTKQEFEEKYNEHFESKSHKKARVRKQSYRARHSHPNDPDCEQEDGELEDQREVVILVYRCPLAYREYSLHKCVTSKKCTYENKKYCNQEFIVILKEKVKVVEVIRPNDCTNCPIDIEGWCKFSEKCKISKIIIVKR